MASPVDADFIRDLFSEFGTVTVRRMFGGAGLFADGLMFGLVTGGVIYLKADAGNVADFEREGCGPFRYATKDGERSIASYRRMPERLYDDPAELAAWAGHALSAARRVELAKAGRNSPTKRRRRRPPA